MSQRQIVVDEPLPSEEIVFHALSEQYLGEHLERFFLAEDNREKTFVYSSFVSGVSGCHVYCFAPSQILERNYWTLVTMGMSGTKMRVPPDVPDAHLCNRAELMCYLPANWKFPSHFGTSEEERSHYTDKNWPIQLLRDLAQYVNVYGAWIAEDHGLPNFISNPPGLPFTDKTKLSHVILLSPVEEHEDMSTCYVPRAHIDEKLIKSSGGAGTGTGGGAEEIDSEGEIVNYYLVVPLTASEANWKREVGASDSIHYIVGNKAVGGENVFVDYVIDPSRPCAVEDMRCRELYDYEHLQQQMLEHIDGEEEEEEEDDDDEEGEGEGEDKESQTIDYGRNDREQQELEVVEVNYDPTSI